MDCLSYLTAALLCTTVIFLLPQTSSADPIDNIRLSRISDETTTEIELGCAMRYLDHSPSGGGTELRVRLALGYDCANALRSQPSALHRPQGSRMANLSIIEFDKLPPDQATITLRFDRPVEFDVRQSANLYMISVVVTTQDVLASSDPAQTLPPAPTVAIPDSRPAVTPREPARQVRRSEPALPDKFVIRLSDMNSLTEDGRRTLERFRSHLIYTNDVVLDQRRWIEVRLGFFDTEQDVDRLPVARHLGCIHVGARHWRVIPEENGLMPSRRR